MTTATWTLNRAELAHICKWVCADKARRNLNVVAFCADGGILATDGRAMIYVGEKYAPSDDSPPWTVPLADVVAATKIAQSAKSVIVITITPHFAHFASGGAEMTVALSHESFLPVSEIFTDQPLSLDDPHIAPKYLARVGELGKLLGVRQWRQRATVRCGPILFTHSPLVARDSLALWTAAVMPCRP